MNKIQKEQLCLKISKIFTRLHYKTNFTMRNTSSQLLPTDLLLDNSKRKLFQIVAFKLEKLFLELIKNESQISLKNDKSFFPNLIKFTTEEFLISCYGCNIHIRPTLINESFYTKYLLEEEKFLLTIPLQILKDSNSKIFYSIFEPIYNKAYDSFIEALLDNLVVEVTNAIMFLILNEFSFIYDLRKNFYRSNFLSLRNVERFRNNLSWQVRVKRFIKRPGDLYNSQQGIWIIRTTGIYYRTIFANRSRELLKLNNFSIITLLSIEIRDFVVSRIDETIYLFGNTIRYTLTSVFGQVIGLVWRGIIEGLKK